MRALKMMLAIGLISLVAFSTTSSARPIDDVVDGALETLDDKVRLVGEDCEENSRLQSLCFEQCDEGAYCAVPYRYCLLYYYDGCQQYLPPL
jgi:hypothetical protein